MASMEEIKDTICIHSHWSRTWNGQQIRLKVTKLSRVSKTDKECGSPTLFTTCWDHCPPKQFVCTARKGAENRGWGVRMRLGCCQIERVVIICILIFHICLKNANFWQNSKKNWRKKKNLQISRQMVAQRKMNVCRSYETNHCFVKPLQRIVDQIRACTCVLSKALMRIKSLSRVFQGNSQESDYHLNGVQTSREL